jgi:hypothetical protein
MSPDPYSGSYDFTNPQSFNRYSYVLNNPLSMTDPLGLDGGGLGGVGGQAGSCGAAAGSDGGDLPADFSCLWSLLRPLFGHPSFNGSLMPRPNAQPWDEHGIIYGPNIAGALGLPDAGCEFGACGNPGAMSVVPGVTNVNTGAVTQFPDTYTICGDFICDPSGHQVAVVPRAGHINEESTIPLLARGAAYAAADIGTVEAGQLFGTRWAGNQPLLNSATNLRIGWGWMEEYNIYVFRIGGKWIPKWINEGHIYLWPPSWWGGLPGS